MILNGLVRLDGNVIENGEHSIQDDIEITEYVIKSVIQITAYAMTKELKKRGLLRLEKTAFEKTKDDVKHFKTALELLADEKVSQDSKKQIAWFVTNIQSALKWLKKHVSEQNFIMFYQFSFNEQSYRKLAVQYKIDESTVKRTIKTCIKQLSIFLYTDLFIDEILN